MIKESNELDKISKIRTWVEIDLDNIQNNVKEFQKIINKDTKLMAVVKANAYGHGMVAVSRRLNYIGINEFAVATLKEAIQLRRNGINGEILVLGVTSITKDSLDLIEKYSLTITIPDFEYALKLNKAKRNIKAHLKIDTGMGRLGIIPSNIDDILNIYKMKDIAIEGIYSHFSVADSLNIADIAYTKGQIKAFKELIEKLRAQKIQVGLTHIHSTYGILNYYDEYFDMVRLGIGMYGAVNVATTEQKPNLKSAFSLKSTISQIKKVVTGSSISYSRTYTTQKDSLIAVVPIGYADGLPRCISNKGYVLINDHKAPIVGNICMDQMMVDITDINNVKVNDEVIVIGRSNKNEITTLEVAKLLNTVPHEIFTNISQRVDMIYK